MRALGWWFVAVVLVLIGGSTAHAQGVDPAREPAAQLRFVHAVPAAAAVDIYLDGERVVSALPSAQATGYGLVRAGSHTVAFRAAGSDAATTPLLETTVELATGHSYTLAMAPRDGQRQSFLYQDDTGTPADARGSLRVVNLSPSVGEVAGVVGEAALTPLLPFGEASERVPVAAESPKVALVTGEGTLLRETLPIPLADGDFYTLFVLGQGPTLQPLVVSYPLTTGGPPQSPSWLPMAATGAAPPQGATAPGQMPSTGQPAEATPIPLLLLVDGLLLMLVALLGGWWWQQRVVAGKR